MTQAHPAPTCAHSSTICLNHYELIRKYRCAACDEIMMCACDEEVGRRFLPHQLNRASDSDTGRRVPVTLGFVERVCRECRGLTPEAHPMASIHGQTSKIKRYYWRELQFLTLKRYAEIAVANGREVGNPYLDGDEAQLKAAQRAALDEIKKLHKTNPRYVYQDESQASVIEDCGVELEKLDATFAPKSEGERALIHDGEEAVPPETYVSRHYEREGWEVLFTESVPFHVIFGVFMWVLIQDPDDGLVQPKFFGSRQPYEEDGSQVPTTAFLPEDFGKSGYGERRAEAIRKHLDDLPDDLVWAFDYWLDHSARLRDYLWAHRPDDINRARKLVEVLPRPVLIDILRYLVSDYWSHYLGWPDLLVYREGEFFFAEVKASRDKLSEEQKRWIRDNSTVLKLPFKLVKINRMGTS